MLRLLQIFVQVLANLARKALQCAIRYHSANKIRRLLVLCSARDRWSVFRSAILKQGIPVNHATKIKLAKGRNGSSTEMF